MNLELWAWMKGGSRRRQSLRVFNCSKTAARDIGLGRKLRTVASVCGKHLNLDALPTHCIADTV